MKVSWTQGDNYDCARRHTSKQTIYGFQGHFSFNFEQFSIYLSTSLTEIIRSWLWSVKRKSTHIPSSRRSNFSLNVLFHRDILENDFVLCFFCCHGLYEKYPTFYSGGINITATPNLYLVVDCNCQCFVGNAQRATTRNSRGMRPGVPLVMAPSLSTMEQGGAEARWIARPWFQTD